MFVLFCVFVYAQLWKRGLLLDTFLGGARIQTGGHERCQNRVIDLQGGQSRGFVFIETSSSQCLTDLWPSQANDWWYIINVLNIKNNYISAILQHRTAIFWSNLELYALLKGTMMMDEIHCICWTDNEKYEDLGLFY